MVSGTNFLAYALFTDATPLLTWGNTALTGVPYLATSSATTQLTVYAGSPPTRTSPPVRSPTSSSPRSRSSPCGAAPVTCPCRGAGLDGPALADGRFQVEPTRVDLSSSAPSGAVTVTNHGAAALRLQATAICRRRRPGPRTRRRPPRCRPPACCPPAPRAPAMVTANVGGVSAQVGVVITPATLSTVTVSPAVVAVPLGTQAQLTAPATTATARTPTSSRRAPSSIRGATARRSAASSKARSRSCYRPAARCRGSPTAATPTTTASTSQGPRSPPRRREPLNRRHRSGLPPWHAKWINIAA